MINEFSIPDCDILILYFTAYCYKFIRSNSQSKSDGSVEEIKNGCKSTIRKSNNQYSYFKTFKRDSRNNRQDFEGKVGIGEFGLSHRFVEPLNKNLSYNDVILLIDAKEH